MHGEPRHLHEIAHRCFRHVGLPVRVADKADRGVEREMLADCGEVLRVERQHALQTLQQIEQHKSGNAESQHGDAIDCPVLVFAFVHGADRVDRAFERAQDWRQKCTFALKDVRQVAANRRGEGDENCAVKHDLNPAGDRHVRTFPAGSARKPDRRGCRASRWRRVRSPMS